MFYLIQAYIRQTSFRVSVGNKRTARHRCIDQIRNTEIWKQLHGITDERVTSDIRGEMKNSYKF
jgi:hypothetical protein